MAESLSVASRLAAVRESVDHAARLAGRSGEVALVAVTKTMDAERVVAAYNAGQRMFGENRVQEAIAKRGILDADMPEATWRLIGHLQSNKANQAVGHFDAIDSVDSLRLAGLVDRAAVLRGSPIAALLEVNVAGEASKTGFSPAEFRDAMPRLVNLPGLALHGLMTIAPPSSDPESVRWVFRQLRHMRDEMTALYNLPAFTQLSMGMSGDYEVAIQEGATMVRIGRAVFGERPSLGTESA